MDVYEAIASRRTIRDFCSQRIPKAVVRKILTAGLHAPSNDHMRQWEFVVVDDQDTRVHVIARVNHRLTRRDSQRIIDKWGLKDGFQREMYLEAIPKQHRMLLEAACLIVPCFHQDIPLLKPKSLSSLNGFASMWCCIENMLLAASAEGIYGVTRIPFDKEIPCIRAVLGIPDDYAIPCYLALGYPAQDLPRIRQHKVKAREKIHYDKW